MLRKAEFLFHVLPLTLTRCLIFLFFYYYFCYMVRIHSWLKLCTMYCSKKKHEIVPNIQETHCFLDIVCAFMQVCLLLMCKKKQVQNMSDLEFRPYFVLLKNTNQTNYSRISNQFNLKI